MIKSFLMLGQSNMAGRGFLDEVPVICNENIMMLRNGRWQMMAEPVNYDRPVAGVSLVGSFSAAWCSNNPEDIIGLIPCAEGGSSLDDWSVDGTLFKHAMSEAKYAVQDSELTGILWHQGENDSSNGNYKVYYSKLLEIIETTRKELNAPDIPVIIGGLGDYLGKTGFGKHCTEYNLVNQELQRFCHEQNNSYYVTAAGLTSNPDGIHINAVSQRKFGLRYYQAFTKKQHIPEPLPNEDQQLNQITQKPLTTSEQTYNTMTEFVLGKIPYHEFESQLTKINSK